MFYSKMISATRFEAVEKNKKILDNLFEVKVTLHSANKTVPQGNFRRQVTFGPIPNTMSNAFTLAFTKNIKRKMLCFHVRSFRKVFSPVQIT